jgi:hypothetical protein
MSIRSHRFVRYANDRRSPSICIESEGDLDWAQKGSVCKRDQLGDTISERGHLVVYVVRVIGIGRQRPPDRMASNNRTKDVNERLDEECGRAGIISYASNCPTCTSDGTAPRTIYGLNAVFQTRESAVGLDLVVKAIEGGLNAGSDNKVLPRVESVEIRREQGIHNIG